MFNESVEVSELPFCAFCNDLARFEGTLIAGAVQSYVCIEHWVAYGDKTLGPDAGRRLVVSSN